MRSDQIVQCDVLTHCAHLYMLHEWVFGSQRAEDGLSRAGRPSTTFLETSIVFRVSSGNPESRLSTPLGLGIRRPLRWLVGATPLFLL